MSEEIIGLLEKFLSNSISKEEMLRLLHAYQKKQISEKQLMDYYDDKWTNARLYPAPFNNQNKERELKHLQEHIRQNALALSKRKTRWFTITSVAAVVVLLFVIGFSLQPPRDYSQHEHVVMVENGQKASIQLPDGSCIHLNSASELRYSADFGRRNRNVKLVGEAFFEVQSSPNNPFIVHTHSDLQIKALGTKFNIKSYPDDEQITGTLVEGRIEVSNQFLSEELNPYEQISFHTKEMTYSKSHINDINEVIFWMTDQFIFEQVTLENIAKMLERSYNVTISFTSPDIKKIQYSGKIKNNSMENILNLITVVSPLQYTISGSHITFSTK